MARSIVLLAACALLACVQARAQVHPPRCGLQRLKQAMIADDPAWAGKFAAQKAGMQAAAEGYIAQHAAKAKGASSPSLSPVPVIFHIVVDSAQFLALGGAYGIAVRCDSQIAVLNRDYNHQNPDSTLIPASWKSLYGDPGIQFGLARRSPAGVTSPGYEVKIISGTSASDAGFDDVSAAFPEAKTAATGLPSWDVTKYYNVWCINFTGPAATLLGLTFPKSFTSPSNIDNEGACIRYSTLGATAQDGTLPPGTGTWYFPYNLGRTLTHETGHFFEIWHPWGDDGGQCPDYSATDTVNGDICVAGIGIDDGLADTPPESDAQYGNPVYDIAGGTLYDCCKMHGPINTQPIGIACLSYMDYTDDDAMHMFTTQQAAQMAAQVLAPTGENYPLTQHPELLTPYPAGTASVNIFPNPTSGKITVTLSAQPDNLQHIAVTNLLGQQLFIVNGQGSTYYNIDLSNLGKGIYFIRCQFTTGSIINKLVVQ